MRAAFAATLLFACAAQAQSPNVAFVADVRGSAMIEGNGPVAFLAPLGPGTRLLLGTGATAAITFAATGSEFTVAGPGEFVVTDAEVKSEKGSAPLLRTVPALSDPAVVTRTSRAATASVRMRGVSPPTTGTTLEYPVDTRVATLKPVLRWKGNMSTEGVMVRVQDSSGKEVWKARMAPNAAPPALKLLPGTRYKWAILTPKGEIAEGYFETLTAEGLARAEKARLGARSFSEKVVHALLLQDLGAGQDAREAWAALARDRPDLPELASLAR